MGLVSDCYVKIIDYAMRARLKSVFRDKKELKNRKLSHFLLAEAESHAGRSIVKELKKYYGLGLPFCTLLCCLRLAALPYFYFNRLYNTRFLRIALSGIEPKVSSICFELTLCFIRLCC